MRYNERAVLSVKLVVLLLTAGGAFLGWAGYTVEMTRRRRAAERRLDRGLGNFSEGEEATIVGTVVAIGEPLAAPVSGKPCVAYRARVWNGHINFSTDPVLTRTRAVPFELDTADGIVQVVAEHAELVFDERPLIPRRVERETAFAQECGVVGTMSDINCAEVCVEVGSKVSVHGVVSMDVAMPGTESGYRDRVAKLKLGPHPEHALTIGEPR